MPSDDELVFTIQTSGLGRDYTLRARSAELLHRWSAIIASAIEELQSPRQLNPLLGASADGLGQRSVDSGRLLGSRDASFPRVPSLFDFRHQAAPRTDNLAFLVLSSAALHLDVLIEKGLPWGEPSSLP